jgi:hypothetical protein
MGKYFIAYERGGLIYGIGKSADRAIDDAEREGADVEPLIAAECTEELYSAVQKDGGWVKYEITYDFPPAKLAAK